MIKIIRLLKLVIAQIPRLFLDIFFPKRCIACGKTGSFLCHRCAGQIEMINTSTCYFCGKITQKYMFCDRCSRKCKKSLDGIIVVARYEPGPIKDLVWAFKYHGFVEISQILGELLAEKWAHLPIESDKAVLTFVPLFRKKERIRGFNQSLLIARYVAVRLSLPLVFGLQRVRDTRTQVNLGKDARMINISGAFVYKGSDLSDKTVYLVDDVATTGSTLLECGRVLKESAHAKKVYGIVVARHI